MAMNMEALLRIRANVQGENNIRRLGNSMQGLQGQVKNLSMSFSGLSAGISGLVGLAGGGLIFAKIFGDTATLQSQAKSLEVLTGNARLASQIISELQSYGAVTPFESTDLIETAKRLNAFGVEASQVVAVTKQLGDVAGATGANLGELGTAYGQVVAKGRLQGEELLQFQERGVALSAELQKMYKLQGQEFTKALEGGRISAEAVQVAIERLTMQGGKYADGAIAQSDTLNGKFSTLKDNITALSQTIGKILTPAMKGILDYAISILETINEAIKVAVSGPQQAAARAAIKAGKLPFGGPAAIDRIIGEARRRELQRQAGPGLLGLGFNEQKFIKLLQQESQFNQAPRQIKPPATPALLPGRASAEKDTQKKAANEAARRREALLASQDQLKQSRGELAIAREANPIKKVALEYEEKRRALIAASDKALRAALSGEEQANIQRTRSVDLRRLEVEKIKEGTAAFKEFYGAGFEAGMSGELFYISIEKTTSAMEDFNAGISSYLDSIGTLGANLSNVATTAFRGLEDSIVSLMTTGAFNFRQFAMSIIEETTRMITRLVIIAPILQGIKNLASGGGNLLSTAGGLNSTVGFGASLLTGFADGGIINRPKMFAFADGGAGRLGLMGEAGPEAIMPLRRGRDGRLGVEAAGGGGAVSVVVNVDAQGTSVQGDSAKGKEFGRVISEAVKNEIVNQKRPGGLLA